jgi:hypothetical protein
VVQGLPPIVGSEGGSTWFGSGGHVSQDRFELGEPALQGFSVLLDAQADSAYEQVILGGGDAVGRLRLALNEGGVPGLLLLHASDAADALFEVRCQLSTSQARRILISAKPLLREAQVYEIHPWAANPTAALTCGLRSHGVLHHIGPGPGQFTLGGARQDGVLVGSFTGRLAETALFLDALAPDRVRELAMASDNPTGLECDALGKPSAEMVERFLRDLTRLRTWATQPTMSANDLDDASLLIFRWLFDAHPVLVDICRLLGVQLWLVGATERESRYLDAIAQDKPTFYVRGPADGPFGFAWCTLDQWRSERLFLARGTPISAEQFIKFVRNKLGAGHFDVSERKKWQRDLLEVSAGLTIMDNDALSFQMRALVDSLLRSIAATRVEELVC